MQHRDFLVDIVNKSGQVVGQKRRGDVQKSQDLFHSVHTLLVTPAGKVVLTKIPDRKALPNIYAHKLGATTATIRRHNETADQAARRSLADKLFLPNAAPTPVASAFFADIAAFISFYYLVSAVPKQYDRQQSDGLVTFLPQQLAAQLAQQPEDFAPTFAPCWNKFGQGLAVF